MNDESGLLMACWLVSFTYGSVQAFYSVVVRFSLDTDASDMNRVLNFRLAAD